MIEYVSMEYKATSRPGNWLKTPKITPLYFRLEGKFRIADYLNIDVDLFGNDPFKETVF